MSVYLIANLTIHDRERYAQYEKGFMEIFQQFQGEAVAVDEAQEVLEGDYDCTRTVILRFPDREAAHAWYDSEAYRELAKHRFAASSGNALIVKGL
ncbi:MAG: DUF1330 domain-containing protein [Proteobacteria bacterium]|nr:DUF1330 domain-containing protein [Pseudomonadota bacterium]